MKLMKKILVSAMAISAIAALNAVAFADEEATSDAVVISPAESAFTVTYSASAGTITLSDVTVANDQKTLLVLNEDVDEFDDTTAAAEAEDGAIVQIDQSTTIADVAIPVGTREASSTLVVRVGGDETFQEVVCTIPGEETPDLMLGDANLSGDLTASDASVVLNAVAGNVELSTDATKCADANKSGDLSASDASSILNAAAGNIELNW